ncbi:hypothetical protein [Aliterella atlantica]
MTKCIKQPRKCYILACPNFWMRSATVDGCSKCKTRSQFIITNQGCDRI